MAHIFTTETRKTILDWVITAVKSIYITPYVLLCTLVAVSMTAWGIPILVWQRKDPLDFFLSLTEDVIAPEDAENPRWGRVLATWMIIATALFYLFLI